MDPKNKNPVTVIHHAKNGEIIDPSKSLSYAITKTLIDKIGLDNLVSVYIPSLNKEVSA